MLLCLSCIKCSDKLSKFFQATLIKYMKIVPLLYNELDPAGMLSMRLLAGLYVTVVSNVSQRVSKLHNYPDNDHSIYITSYYVSR